MKPLYHLASIMIAIFASSFLSALAISLLWFGHPSAVFLVVIYCFFGTMLFGAPVSAVIHLLIKSERPAAIATKLLLHMFAAALIILVWLPLGAGFKEALYEGGGAIFLYSAMINAVIYFAAITFAKRIFAKSTSG